MAVEPSRMPGDALSPDTLGLCRLSVGRRLGGLWCRQRFQLEIPELVVVVARVDDGAKWGRQVVSAELERRARCDVCGG